jgi:hypothetical protein
LAFWTLVAAWSFAQTPREISVGRDGLTILRRRGSQSYRWDEIGWATITTVPVFNRRRLVLFDAKGQTLAKIDEDFEEFDRLERLVKKRIAATGPEAAERIRTNKARRAAAVTAAGSTVMLALCGFMIWKTHADQLAAHALEEHGVEGQAAILRHFIAPNGITRRIEYRVTTPDGRSGTRNVEVIRPVWELLEGESAVAVVYDPDNPGNSRLVSGQADEKDDITDDPIIVYGLCAFLGLICILGWASAILHWNGLSIDLDSKTGKVSIKPFGTGR